MLYTLLTSILESFLKCDAYDKIRPLTSGTKKAFSPKVLPLYRIFFSFYRPFSVYFGDEKIPVYQQFRLQHQQPCHCRSDLNFFYLTPSWCSVQLRHNILTLPTRLNTLSFCHVISWLGICVNRQLKRCI